MTKLLKTDFQHTEIEPKGNTFQIGELRKLLDCQTIQVLYLMDIDGNPTEDILIIDEEGKYKKDATINITATDLWWRGHMPKNEYKLHSAGLNLLSLSYCIKNEIDFIAGDAIKCNTNLLK